MALRITVNGADQFTDWAKPHGKDFTIAIKPASLIGTVVVQAKRPTDDDADAYIVEEFVNGVIDGTQQMKRGQLGISNWLVRIGIATGGFTSGTAVVECSG